MINALCDINFERGHHVDTQENSIKFPLDDRRVVYLKTASLGKYKIKQRSFILNVKNIAKL